MASQECCDSSSAYFSDHHMIREIRNIEERERDNTLRTNMTPNLTSLGSPEWCHTRYQTCAAVTWEHFFFVVVGVTFGDLWTLIRRGEKSPSSTGQPSSHAGRINCVWVATHTPLRSLHQQIGSSMCNFRFNFRQRWSKQMNERVYMRPRMKES